MDERRLPLRGIVTFDENRCKGCGLCVNACPVHILELDASKMNAIGYHPSHSFAPDKCIACGSCALMCPDTVITVERVDK
ncbi:MAG: 4Fe-4S binding protein [Erysipelotrichaceae bacterium]|nr:4Fe-4S binding protein [Erysipelotrichaceae bacterium]